MVDMYGRIPIMNDQEYMQDENETSDWLVYAEYLIWSLSKEREGMSHLKIEDGRCGDSQQETPLTN